MHQIWLVDRKWAPRGFEMVRVYFLQNLRWRTAAILKMLKLQ